MVTLAQIYVTLTQNVEVIGVPQLRLIVWVALMTTGVAVHLAYLACFRRAGRGGINDGEIAPLLASPMAERRPTTLHG